MHNNTTMPRVVWSKIAKVLKEECIEGNKCKLCGKEIELGETGLDTLKFIYRHFKEEHPSKIEEIKAKLTE